MQPFWIILYTLLLSSNPSRSIKDTCEIKGNGYNGYIMPISGTNAKSDPENVYYRPSVSEVVLAEKMLGSYLDIFCRLNNGWKDLALSPSDSVLYRGFFTSYFKGYYRQYAAYIPKNGTHKFVSINLVSPAFRDEVKDKPDFLKRELADVDDGAWILFHADIDLVTGDVFLRDNGS